MQARSEADGGVLSAAAIWAAFRETYLLDGTGAGARWAVRAHQRASEEDGSELLTVDLTRDGAPLRLAGRGTGPIDAFAAALASHGVELQVLDYAEHALAAGRDARAAAYVECAIGGRTLWGVGTDRSIVRASLQAVVSAVNRAGSQQPGV